MLELTASRNPQLPNWVELDKAIPGYVSMSGSDKLHYEDLYVLACHPELLQQPPEDVRDLHALVYFIFQYNLTNPVVEGKRIKIVPFMPVKWTHKSDLSMSVLGDCEPLLAQLSELLPLKSLYFCVLMLSLTLIITPNSREITYHRFYVMLADILNGDYNQTKLETLKKQENELKEPWVINYIPDPTHLTVSADDSRVQDVRSFLLGSPAKLGLFEPPKPLREVAASQAPLWRGACLIL